jgi:hypothetical protein
MFQFLRCIALIAAMMFGCEAAVAVDATTATYTMPGCRDFLVSRGQKPLFESNCAVLVRGLSYAGSGVCAPADFTDEQAVHIVVQYIDDRPERQHENFRALALEALQAAFPCKR